MVRQNKFFYHGWNKKEHSKDVLGLFHKLPFQLRKSLLKMSTKHSKQQRLLDIETLREQRTEKKRKKDLAIQKKINRASKDLIENTFFV